MGRPRPTGGDLVGTGEGRRSWATKAPRGQVTRQCGHPPWMPVLFYCFKPVSGFPAA